MPAISPLSGQDVRAARIVAVFRAVVDRPYALPLGLSPVPAGFPSPAEEYTQGRLDLIEHIVRNPATTLYVRVEGVSMVKAGILHGDLLIVDRSLTAVSGDIVIARLDGEDLVKYYRRDARGVWLVADAEDPTAFPPLLVTEDRTFEIWGVVAGVARVTRKERGRGVRPR